MSEIWMRGNGPLEGEVKVQGSKNAALPMMAAVFSIVKKRIPTPDDFAVTTVPGLQMCLKWKQSCGRWE